jgi:hypothetical protein
VYVSSFSILENKFLSLLSRISTIFTTSLIA